MGREELFDERKVYASCYSACLSSHISHMKAEKVAGKVTKDINKWIKTKKNVTSDQIFKETTKAIKRYNREASFMFETHRDIS